MTPIGHGKVMLDVNMRILANLTLLCYSYIADPSNYSLHVRLAGTQVRIPTVKDSVARIYCYAMRICSSCRARYLVGVKLGSMGLQSYV